MNSLILNRDFTHPADGWYQIEAKGNHPNRAAGVIQVIDGEAAQSIVNRFNNDARSGTLRHGNEMLIDHEHFSDQPDKESRAYGWLTELQNRDDGIYGRIRWTKTGKEAVDGGDYRFFSTEYSADDLKLVNDGKPKKVRPVRLDGLSLTNMNNNRGQKPITNRSLPAMPKDGMCPDCDTKLVKDDDGDGDMMCPDCKKHFAGASASAGKTETNQTKNKMSKVNSLLGLSADAEESSVIEAVTKLLNRGDITVADLTTLKNRSAELETETKTLLSEQVDALLDAHGVTEEKVRNRLKGVIAGLKNRQERVDALVDFGFKQVEAVKGNERQQQTQLRNRDTKQPEKGAAADTDDQAKATKIKNRALELQGKSNLKFADAFAQATREFHSAQ